MTLSKQAPSAASPKTWAHDLPDYVSDLRFSPDGRLLAAGSLAGDVAVLDAESGSERHRDAGHAGGTLALAWSPDGRWLATGGQDGQIGLVDVSAQTTMEIRGKDRAWVEHLAWSPDGKVLAAAAGRSVYFYDRTGQLRCAADKHASTVTGIAWRPGGSTLISSCYGGLQEIGPESPEPVRRFEWKGSVIALAASLDGRFIATGNQEASIHLWNVKTGKELDMSGYPTKVRTVMFSPDSNRLASGANKAIVVWDMRGKGPAKSEPRVLEEHTGTVTGVEFFQNAGMLMSCSEDGTLRAWALEGSRKAKAVLTVGAPLVRLAQSPKGGHVAVGGRNGRITAFKI